MGEEGSKDGMTDKEKLRKFTELQAWLWDAAIEGHPLQSALCSIDSPISDSFSNRGRP